MNRLEQKYGTNYTVKEVAEYFGKSEHTIYTWCHKGKLGTFINGGWRIFDKDIEALLEKPEYKEFKLRKGRKKNINSLLKKSQSIT